MPQKAPIIVIDTIKLDTFVANDATASSAWVSASDLLMQILQRQERHTSNQPLLPMAAGETAGISAS